MLSHSVVSYSLRPHGLYSLPGSTVLGDSPGKNTGEGCHALLWGNLPALQADSLSSEPRLGSYPFCRGSSWPRNQTGVSCIAGRFFTSWKWKSLGRVRFCDPMDYIVHGIPQARIRERVAFPFSRESSQPRYRTQVSRIVGRFFTSWAPREAQEYRSG